jgi:hypothetical protein
MMEAAGDCGHDEISILDALRIGPIFPFADWSAREVPDRGGAYTIWELQSGRFVYAGIAGEKAVRASGGTGLRRRLGQHAKGDRSGDRFCVYVQDRFVLPTCTLTDLQAFSLEAGLLDRRVRAYVRERLGYRYIVAPTGTARQIEARLKRGDWPAGPPLLNPFLNCAA